MSMEGNDSTRNGRISSRLVAQAERSPDRLFVRCADGELTFGEMADVAARGAGFLRSLGVRRGDRLVSMLGNTVEAAALFFACAHSGIALVPLNPQHRGEVLRYMVGHAEPAVCIADATLVDEHQLADLDVVAARSQRLSAFLASARTFDPAPMSTSADDILAIMYTSGTTGRSKGAVIGHPVFLATAAAYNLTVEPRGDDVYFTTLPLFHGNALGMSLCGALDAGVPFVAAPRFSASGFFEQARTAGASVTNVLGVMTPILLKTYEQPVRDHRLRMFIGGGIPIALMNACEDRFGITYRELFGLTETGIDAGNRGTEVRTGSFGKPYPHVEIRIEPEGVGSDTGEIQIRALEPDVIMREYWRDPDRTSAAFTPDGWFRTGDRGRVDGDGFFYFRGRIKDSIRRRGENISPSEIEAIVDSLPGVLECVALAVPAEMGEDEVKLVYVVRAGHNVTPEDVHAYCVASMARFMVPRYIERVDRIPKTATEKVDKTGLSSTTNATVVDFGGVERRAKEVHPDPR